MTWKEIKNKIESQGVTDSTDIEYIDSCYEYEVRQVSGEVMCVD